MSDFEAILMMILLIVFSVACYICGKGDLITVSILALQEKARELEKAQEERKQNSYWCIGIDQNNVETEIKCSYCGYTYIEADPNVKEFYNYCPNCGKEMRVLNNE